MHPSLLDVCLCCSFPRTHTRSLSHSLAHTLSRSHTLSLSRSYARTHTLPLSLSLQRLLSPPAPRRVDLAEPADRPSAPAPPSTAPLPVLAFPCHVLGGASKTPVLPLPPNRMGVADGGSEEEVRAGASTRGGMETPKTAPPPTCRSSLRSNTREGPLSSLRMPSSANLPMASSPWPRPGQLLRPTPPGDDERREGGGALSSLVPRPRYGASSRLFATALRISPARASHPCRILS